MASFRKRADLRGTQVFLPHIGLVRDGATYEGNLHQFCPQFLEILPEGQAPVEATALVIPSQGVLPPIPPVAPSLEKNLLKEVLEKMEPETQAAPEGMAAIKATELEPKAEELPTNEEDKGESKTLAEQALRRKGNAKKPE